MDGQGVKRIEGAGDCGGGDWAGDGSDGEDGGGVGIAGAVLLSTVSAWWIS